MKRNFGGVRQLGIVVRNAREAMLYWARTMGVGPFYVAERISFQDYRYRGEPAVSPVVTLGFAQAGDLQIEIIEQHDDAPSGYRDFLASGREGCQHISSWFESTEAFDAAYASARAAGAQVVHEGNMGGGPRFAYFSTIEGTAYGLDFEISEGLLPMLEPTMKLLHDAARGWDGQDPIRPMPG